MDIDRIQLSTDADQQAKLRRKLDEYKARIAAKAPQIDADSACKAFVLTELLEKGSIDPQAIFEKMTKEAPYRSHVILNAIQVVAAYNANDTSILYKSTGLS